MNFPPHMKNRLPSRSTKGIALILVLAVLVLITGLVLAFFSSVTTELVGAKSYSNGVSGKQLADSATQLVIGTIRKATSPEDGGSGTNFVWASQPGMIRTWKTSATPDKCYKLYSSDLLEVPAAGYTSSGEVSASWNDETALFTDLNAPVTNDQNEMIYPILDPRADPANTAYDASIAGVQGFNITDAPVKKVGTFTNDAPMPVKWLYVLRNGSLVAATGAGKIASVGAATTDNPIVGRVAYWTDDETCKVNINTASEGTYWDMPHLLTEEDCGRSAGSNKPTIAGLSLCQPTSGEYQRYPGHPATTSLSPVLGALLQAPDPTKPVVSANAPLLKPYYELAPRVNDGGSLGGTTMAYYAVDSSKVTTGTIVPDADRLYSSVDEMLFKQPTSATDRGLNNNKITRQTLQRTRFFLTAHSSGPEVTIFNTPRISMWPEWKDASPNTSKRTLFDKTIAFCSTIKGAAGATGGDAYYFTRENPRNNDDWTNSPRNRTLYSYLLKMMQTNIPGYGTSLQAKFSTDTDQIATSIFDYIRCINLYDVSLYKDANTLKSAEPFTPLITIDTPNPSHKFYKTKDKAIGAGEVVPIKINDKQGFGRTYTISNVDLVFSGVNAVSTSDSSATSIQAVILVTFNSPMEGLPGIFPNLRYRIDISKKANPAGNTPFSVISSTGGRVPLFASAAGLNYIDGFSGAFQDGRGMGGMDDPHMTMLTYTTFAVWRTAPSAWKPADTPGSTQRNKFPFVSQTVTLKDHATNNGANGVKFFDFAGGTMDITVEHGNVRGDLDSYPSGSPTQVIHVTFPDGSFPIPTVKGPIESATLLGYPLVSKGQFRKSGGGSGEPTILEEDVVRGVEIAGPGDDPNDNAKTSNSRAGDVRMIAALPEVPAVRFHPHNDYFSTNVQMKKATGMMPSNGSANRPDGSKPSFPDSTHGSLAKGLKPRYNAAVPTAPYYYGRNPNLPSRVAKNANDTTGVLNSTGTGDWSTGFGLMKDGAYLGMGDMGDFAYRDTVDGSSDYRYPYVTKEDHFNTENGVGSYFSPNRIVSSSMILGSIPTGVQAYHPWETLLFRSAPDDLARAAQNPPDHLMADFFWMPVVEPYAISQPFSTAGKININYQIQPFTYIKRSTGIYAVMKATKFAAWAPSLFAREIRKEQLGIGDVRAQSKPDVTRFAINIPETLKGFEKKFDAGDIFKTASEICDINLVPDKPAPTTTYDSMGAFWNNHTATGDNLREKPYVDIYPRLTTKSNSYTVHFRVQSLQKSPNTPAGVWDDDKDKVLSEYRGSSEIERYLDASDPTLPDFAALMAANPSDNQLNLDKYYRYRVISTKRFAP